MLHSFWMRIKELIQYRYTHLVVAVLVLRGRPLHKGL